MGDLKYNSVIWIPFISNEMNAGVFKGGKNWNWKDE
jgi:hypothetical protein